MIFFDELYGIPETDLEKAAKSLEEALNVELEPRYNEAWGGNIHSWHMDEKSILLHPNFDREANEWIHEEYSEFPLVLLIELRDTIESEHEPLLHKTRGFHPVLLKREYYDSETKQDVVLFKRDENSSGQPD